MKEFDSHKMTLIGGFIYGIKDSFSLWAYNIFNKNKRIRVDCADHTLWKINPRVKYQGKCVAPENFFNKQIKSTGSYRRVFSGQTFLTVIFNDSAKNFEINDKKQYGEYGLKMFYFYHLQNNFSYYCARTLTPLSVGYVCYKLGKRILK